MPGSQMDNPKQPQKKIEKDTNGTSKPSAEEHKTPSIPKDPRREPHDEEIDMGMIQSFPSQRKW